MRIKTISEFLEKLPKRYLTFFAFLLVLVIGGLDTITSYDMSISILYIFPIILIAWYEGGVPAALLSIFSAVTWAVSDLASGHVYSHIAVRNTIIVLALFLLVTYFIAVAKKLLRKRR